MLQEKQFKLIKVLNEVIDKYAGNNLVRNYIIAYMVDKNILASYGTRFLGKKINLSSFDFDKVDNVFIVYSFTKAFRQALHQIDRVTGNTIGLAKELYLLDVREYFTSLEIEHFDSIDRLPDKQESKYPYVFDNVLKVSDGHYITVVSAQRLSEIDNANDIQYNFNIQRDAKIDVFGMKKINVNQNKIKEIKSNLLKGTQFSDEIKINVLRDGEDNVQFKSKDGVMGKLIIGDGIMNIFDGYHRKTANTLAVIENPQLNFNWKLTITNFTEGKAKDFMVQINKQTPMKKEYIKNLDPHAIENVVVDLLNDNPTCVLYNNVKDNIQELKYGGYTRKLILATAIKECYGNILNRANAQVIAKYIEVFMNNIGSLFERECSVAAKNQNTFYFYIALSAYLYKENLTSNDVKYFDILNVLGNSGRIDFEDINFWKEFDLFSNNINKSNRQKLYNLIERVI